MTNETKTVEVEALRVLNTVSKTGYTPCNRGISEAVSYLLQNRLCEIDYRENQWGLVATSKGKATDADMKKIYEK